MMASLDTTHQPADTQVATLWKLLRAELTSGIFGLRLFIACTFVSTLLLGMVWILGSNLTSAIQENGRGILGGDVSLEVNGPPLDAPIIEKLTEFGTLSTIVELRGSARVGDQRAPIEIKGVDNLYPLYGKLSLNPDSTGRIPDLQSAMTARNGVPGAVVEATLLSRLSLNIGDMIGIGQRDFEIRAVINIEPDRLSSRRFLVGPRVMVELPEVERAGLLVPGSLSEYRYRIAYPDGTDERAAQAEIAKLEPGQGWSMTVTEDAGDRVLRTVERTTTFLGIAGIVALAIGLTGTWSAALVWVGRRARTIALYRLSGASPALVVWLHGAILVLTGIMAIIAGLVIATAIAGYLTSIVAATLHLNWSYGQMTGSVALVFITLLLGLAGASVAALSAAHQMPPGVAMRSGEAELKPTARHIAIGLALIALAVLLAVMNLPLANLAALAALGLVAAACILGGAAVLLSSAARRQKSKSFAATVIALGLSSPGALAVRTIALGIGIAGITAIMTAQSSFQTALVMELPERIPDLVLIDVQKDQAAELEARVADTSDLFGLQSMPNLRTRMLAVNGVPAEEALVLPEKAWVIEGDRSFSWAAEPTGAELLAGEWWPADYNGPPLISAEEDVYEAFDLKVGDTITYSVFGRTFTSTVANIRKEYHRTFRPEFLLVASPNPFENAPHGWVLSLQGSGPDVVNGLIRDLAATAANITTIDVRQIVNQVTGVVNGVVAGTLAIAGALLLGGVLTLAAVVAGDVDSRRRDALAFTLVGVSRMEVARIRLTETVIVGVITAVLGGVLGNIGGYWLVYEALRVEWAPGAAALMVPVLLGVVAALAAAIAAGIGAVPRGRGQLVRVLAN